MDTNACVDHFTATTDFPRDLLDKTIGPAIDALYTARDSDKMLHEAGASAAVAALKALGPFLTWDHVTVWLDQIDTDGVLDTSDLEHLGAMLSGWWGGQKEGTEPPIPETLSREDLVESHDNWMHRAKDAEGYLLELLGLILDDMQTATNRDLAADGDVGDEEGEVWSRIEALAGEARREVFEVQ